MKFLAVGLVAVAGLLTAASSTVRSMGKVWSGPVEVPAWVGVWSVREAPVKTVAVVAKTAEPQWVGYYKSAGVYKMRVVAEGKEMILTIGNPVEGWEIKKIEEEKGRPHKISLKNQTKTWQLTLSK